MPSLNRLARNVLLAALAGLAVASSAVAQTAVTWQSPVNVSVVGTTVTKTGGADGVPDAGALSADQITSAGGAFSFITTAASVGLLVGLSNDPLSNSSSAVGMTHSFNFATVAGNVEVREALAYRTDMPWATGDVFSLVVDATGHVLYQKNGATVYTSLATVTTPVKLDSLFLNASGSITNATFTGAAAPPGGSTYTVCGTNCAFNNGQLQSAINAAAAAAGPMLILLEEGRLYTGDFTLPVKADASATNTITIRTGVSATGVVQPLSRYVDDNVRICPSTFTDATDPLKDCPSKPGSTDMTRIAKIQPASNNGTGITTAWTASGTPVSYYNLRWLEFVANSYGGNSLIALTNQTAPVSTGTTAMIPHHFKLDQIVVRGDPLSGQFRGLYIDANFVDVTNSFFYDINSVSEGQPILILTSTGGNSILTNFLSGGTETFLEGGGGTFILPQYTVQSGATTTVVPLDRVTDLRVGKNLAFRLNSQVITSTSAANPTIITTPNLHGLTSGWQVVFSGTTCSGALNGSGASGGWPSPTVTVLSTTTFSVPVSCAGGAGSGGSFYVRAQAEITAIAGNTITVTPALPLVPSFGVLADSSIVPGEANPNVMRYNWITRPAANRTTPIQAPPTGVGAVGSTTGGTLTAGTYGYKVLAQRLTTHGVWASSLVAAEVTGTVASGTTGSVTISWSAPIGAGRYVVYGRTPAGQTMSWTVTSGTTFTDTGTAGTGASVPTSATFWLVKNTLEFKVGTNWTVEYNLIENSWFMGQSGPCIPLTTTQQTNQAPSAVIRDFTFRYNVVRHCAQFMQLPGTDAQATESARAGRITISNNLFYDGGSVWGVNTLFGVGGNGGGQRQHPNRGPFDVTIDRNTIHSTGNTASRTFYLDQCSPATDGTSLESPIPNFIFRNNIAYAGTNGAAFASTGLTSSNCNAGTINRRVGIDPAGPLGAGSIFTNNILVGDANCGGYPVNVLVTTCPTLATVESGTFTNTTSVLGFKVKATSPYFTASTTGNFLGADIDAIDTAMTTIVIPGNNTGGTVAPDPLVIVTSSPLETAFIGQPYTLTLLAAGGTGPYTWDLTAGTLPAGLTLNASTGIISGTPTTAVTARSLTVRATGTLGLQASKTVTIDVMKQTARASRYNFSESATFRRATAPKNPGDQVWEGDRWYDLSTHTLKIASVVAGTTITWTAATGSGDLSNLNASNLTSGTVATARLGSGGTPSSSTFLRGDNTWASPTTSGAPAVQTIAIWGGTAQVMTPAAVPTDAANEFPARRFARLRMDTENSTQCAITVTVHEGSAVAGNTIKLQYFNGTVFVDAGCGVAIDVVPSGNPIIQEGVFAPIAAGGTGQLRPYRLLVSTGNGTDTVTIGTAYIHFR